MNLNKPLSILIWIVLILVISSSRGFAISIPEEKELAEKFMAKVHERQMILKDPVASHYLNQIGNHILALIPPQPFKFSFYVVDDDVFNAFAAPGGNVFAYRGLITSLDTADELAGIIGHEIAHASNRHVSEAIDRSKYISLGTLAGMLAGAIIAGKSESDAGQAVMQGSLALGQTTMLAFTRENETEADEQGVMFLKRSCFSPWGLLAGLNKIRQADFRGVEGIPDYVKTHPGTGKRIAHTETILTGYTPQPQKTACPMDFSFDMIKYRLLGLYGPLDNAYQTISTRLAKDPENAALNYGMGLVYARKQRKQEALDHLKKALDLRMLDAMILTDLGRVYLMEGYPQKALNVLQGIESEPGTGILARLYQARAHLDLSDIVKAERGYKAVINKAPDAFPEAYFNLARIKSMNQEKGLSHYYLGVHYQMTGNSKNAVHHLKKSITDLNDDAKIADAEERLKQIKKEKKSKIQ